MNSHQSRFLLFLLGAGIVGCTLKLFSPANFVGGLLFNLFLIGLFFILTVIPHELGHALAARAVGWRVHQIVIGVGKPLFKRRWLGILVEIRSIPLAGATLMTPRDTRWFRIRRLVAILAGPGVNLASAALIIFVCQGDLRNFNFDTLPEGAKLFLFTNIWVALTNLWPHQPKSGFGLPSDGKQILDTIAFHKKALAQVQGMRFALEANFCREEHDIAGAQTWCKKGLAMFPEDPHLLNLSALISMEEQDYEQARQLFQKLLAQPTQAAAVRFVIINNLAYVNVLSENPAWLPEADAYSRDAYTALPWMAAIVGTRGAVLVAKGQFEEGLTLLRRSFEDSATARSKAENACHIANALVKTGQIAEAQKYFTLASQLDPKCSLLSRTQKLMEKSTCGVLISPAQTPAESP